MRFSPLVARLRDGAAAEGVGAWEIHFRALTAASAGEDVIVLSVGDPDLDTPGPVRAAAQEALAAGDTHYQPIAGRPSLRRAVAAHYSARWGRELGPKNVMIAAGAQNALFFACQCLLGPGDELITPEPTYVSYAATAAAPGGVLVRTPSPAEAGFRPDLDALAAAVGPRTRALLLADPNNPTGVVLSPAERARIAEIAEAHDLWVIADAVYETLCFERDYAPLAAEPGLEGRVATLGSVSKSHAMAGWRAGWAIAPAELVEAFDALGHCALYGLPGFVQAGAEAALADQETPVAYRALFRRRRDLMFEGLAAIPGLAPQRAEAGMFTLVDIRALGVSTAEFARSLFETEGVSVLDGAAFGPSAEGHIRLSAAVDETRIAEALRRIARHSARF